MKKLKRIYLMAAVALLTAGCSEQDAINQQGRTPVNLGYTLLESQTRAATDLNEDWLTSGTLKVSMKGHAATGYPAFVAYTATDGGALTPPTSGRFYYPSDGSSVDIVACYPSETFTAVETDQTTDDAYLASDLMWANVENQKATGHTVNLQLRHLMSKIVINASAGEGVTSITSVTLKNVKPGVSFTPATGVVGNASGSAGNITMANNGAALIPPQTIDGTFLEIVTNAGTAAYSVESKAFLSGYQYTLDITINQAALGATTLLTGWTSEGSITVEPTVKNPSIFDDRAPAGVEAVDLGIEVNGERILFANMNVGAETETDFGLYFAWGETTGYGSDKSDGRSFDWVNYKWSAGDKDGSLFSKYVPTSQSSYWGGEGDPDNKLVLDYSDDAARVHWGGDWRMPTKAELEALVATRSNTTDYTWTFCNGSSTTYNGSTVKGWQVKYKANNATIFLPLAGYRGGTNVINPGTYGNYWSSALPEDYAPELAFHFNMFSNSTPNVVTDYRPYGYTVRPVKVSSISYRMGKSATSDDVGKVICSKGHIHNTVSDIGDDGCYGEGVAVIAYVGSAGSVDESSNRYKGLAIALSDASENSRNRWAWDNTTSNECLDTYVVELSDLLGYKDGIENTNTLISHNTHGHAAARICRLYTPAAPTNYTSDWFLPSLGQWQLIVQGLASKKAGTPVTEALSEDYGNNNYMLSNLNSVITDAGGTGFQNSYYWSSSESWGDSYAWFITQGGKVDYGFKTNTYCVRAVLAF